MGKLASISRWPKLNIQNPYWIFRTLPSLCIKCHFLLLFIAGLSCLSNGQVYSDLKDQGYQGSVKQVITRYYSEISLHNGKWFVIDSLHPGIVLTEYFNREGNYTRKESRTSFDTSITELNYSNKAKPVWIKKNNNGAVTETATISVEDPNIRKELIVDETDSSITQLTRFLDARKITMTLEEKGFDAKGTLVYHAISGNEDDPKGRFWKVKTEDKLKKTNDIFDFQLLKRDRNNNPTEIITRINGKVTGIRLVSISYYTE